MPATAPSTANWRYRPSPAVGGDQRAVRCNSHTRRSIPHYVPAASLTQRQASTIASIARKTSALVVDQEMIEMRITHIFFQAALDTKLDSVKQDVRFTDKHLGRRIDSSELQLAL